MSSHYNSKGLYNKYNKAHKERAELDYYATPSSEVTNILETLNYNFNNKTLLEPSCGGGHMLEGILQYLNNNNQKANVYGSDIKDRGYSTEEATLNYEVDFISDDYYFEPGADVIIMNPPFSIIEPFVIRALDVAKEKVIMFGRLQFLEGQGRYENILKNNPPTLVYVYVDRVNCYKNGDFSVKQSGVQAYAWFIWDKLTDTNETKLYFLRRK